MDAETLFSVVNIVEAGTRGDSSAVQDYARQLAATLKQAGSSEEAESILAAVKAKKVKRASVSRRSPNPIPVDGESRLPIADVSHPEPESVLLDENVSSMVRRFVDCAIHADRLAQMGVSAPSALLLHGPPGCGKTLVAGQIAAELKMPLVTARTDALVSSFLGSTSKNVRALFEYAAENPCVLFLDEFDALAKMRDDDRELGELKRVVISLLQNIDGSGKDHLLIAATNHPHLLDKAVWRRFSYTVEIPLPSTESRRSMIGKFFGDNIDNDIADVLAHITNGLSGAAIRTIADDAIRDSILSGHGMSGKLIARMVAHHLDERYSSASDREIVRFFAEQSDVELNRTAVGRLVGVHQSTVSRWLNEEKDSGRRVSTAKVRCSA